MAFIRFVLWTTVCLAAGVYLGAADWRGATIARKYIANSHSPTPAKLTENADRAVQEAHRAFQEGGGRVASAAPARPSAPGESPRPLLQEAQPKEQHSASDREAIDRLIGKKR
jgi:hypothetical protein